jgi:hypothetical protein
MPRENLNVSALCLAKIMLVSHRLATIVALSSEVAHPTIFITSVVLFHLATTLSAIATKLPLIIGQ